ncbi:hypothetical protein B0H13DRAFT_1719353 [Mycena leptocephala]|nr:hypothetical protein B0H13DRAFT_1719353 [Mycena leptocephala]
MPGLINTLAKLSRSQKADYFTLVSVASPRFHTLTQKQVQKGANDARSDDFRRVTRCMAQWINEDSSSDKPDLKVNRSNRGADHDITGGLLTSTKTDWNNPRTCDDIRSSTTVGSNYFFRVFYEGFQGDPKKVVPGFLKSRYVVKSYKAVFTAPSSAEDDDENTPPMKKLKAATGGPIGKAVATILGMNGMVTPRSIAYVAVLVWLSLTNVSTWKEEYYSVSLPQMYDFIVDFFEEPAVGSEAREGADALLSWWNQQIFPAHASSAATHKTSIASRAALRAERMHDY